MRDKQFLYEGGLKVPLIVRYPKMIKQGKADKQLVSLIDLTATSLDLAGIKVPENMHGNVFLGKQAKQREFVYGFRDRAGDAVENIRSITDGRYKLIWNRMPETPWMQVSGYKKSEYPAFALYHYLHKRGELKAPFSQFMAESKPEIELYDLKKDPMELNNFADTKKYKKIKAELYQTLVDSVKEFEVNMIPESSKMTKQAKASSAKYYQSQLKKMKLPANATIEELLKYWENKLLK